MTLITLFTCHSAITHAARRPGLCDGSSLASHTLKNMAGLIAENDSLTLATRFSVYYTPEPPDLPCPVYARESDVYPVFLVEALFFTTSRNFAQAQTGPSSSERLSVHREAFLGRNGHPRCDRTRVVLTSLPLKGSEVPTRFCRFTDCPQMAPTTEPTQTQNLQKRDSRPINVSMEKCTRFSMPSLSYLSNN